MFCNNCGYKNDDFSNFCLQCGNKLEHRPIASGSQQQSISNEEAPNSQQQNDTMGSDIPGNQPQGNIPYSGIPGGQPQESAPNSGIPKDQPQSSLPYPGAQQQNTVPYFGMPSGQPQGNVPYSAFPGDQPQGNPPYSGNAQAIAPKKNRKRLLLIIIPVVVLVAVSVIAAVLLLRPKKTPIMDNILDALKGTMEADSVAFDLSYKEESADYNESGTAEGVLEYDLAKGKLNFDMNMDDQTEYILYDGIGYYLEDGYLQYSDDMEDDLDTIFDYYKEYNTGLQDPGEVDWADAVDEADLSTFVDGKKLKACILQLQKKLNDKDFYNSICNEFKVTKKDKETTYYFDFDAPETINAIIDIIEPSLTEGADDIKDFVAGPSEMLSTLTLKISIEENRVTSFELNCGYTPEADAEQSITIKLRLTDYNKASIDEAKVTDVIENAPDDDSAIAFPGPSKDTTAPEPTMAPENNMESANLEFWYLTYGESNPIIEDSINRFMADYPNCTVNIVPMEYSDYNSRIALAMASGDMPDIFMTYTDVNFYNYIKDGQIRDITENMDMFNYKDKFLDASIAQASYADSIYAVPVGGTTLYGVFYNKDIFNQYGLSEPTTIEELEQICDTLLENGITPFELGNMTSFFGSIYFSCLAARKSGVSPYLDALGGNSYALEDGFLYAGNKLQEWINKGYINADCNSIEDYDARTVFYNGTGAMYLNGSWNISNIMSEAPNFFNGSLGFFEFPAYVAGDANSRLAIGTFGDTFYSVSSSCEYPELAFNAIAYLIDDKAVEQLIANSTLPPLKDYVPVNVLDQEIMDAAKQCTNVHQIYSSYLPSDASNEFYNSIVDIFGLTRTPQEILDSIIALMPAY